MTVPIGQDFGFEPKINLPYFFGRLAADNIELRIKANAMRGNNAKTYFPGNLIHINPASETGLQKYGTDEVTNNQKTTKLICNKADYHKQTDNSKNKISVSFANDNPENFDIQVIPKIYFPDVIFYNEKNAKANSVYISKPAANPFDEITLKYEINFDYTKTGSSMSNVDKYPSDTEWRDYVHSNILELQNELKKYHIDIQEQKNVYDNTNNYGKLIIKPFEGNGSSIPVFNETFTYSITYGDETKQSKPYKFTLDFNFSAPTIECTEERSINFLKGFGFTEEIPVETTPYEPSKNVVFPIENVKVVKTDWPDTNEPEKFKESNSSLSINLIPDGKIPNKGILKIEGLINYLPDPDGWDWWFGNDASNITLQYKTSTSGEPISTHDLEIYWKESAVKIKTESPVEIEYSANKEFEIELPVSAVVIPKTTN